MAGPQEKEGIGPRLKKLLDLLPGPSVLPPPLFRAPDYKEIIPDKPATWEPSPIVKGSKGLAKEFYKFERLNPNVAKGVADVTSGPTLGSMKYQQEQGGPIDAYTHLSGVAETPRSGEIKRHIGLDPNLYPSMRSQTLGHELGHIAARDKIATDENQSAAENYGALWRQLYRGKLGLGEDDIYDENELAHDVRNRTNLLIHELKMEKLKKKRK